MPDVFGIYLDESVLSLFGMFLMGLMIGLIVGLMRALMIGFFERKE